MTRRRRLVALARGHGDLAGDAAWSTVADVVALAVNVVTFLLVGRSLGPVGYGEYVAFYGVVGPVGTLSWSGLVLLTIQRRVREGEGDTALGRCVTLALVQALPGAVLVVAISAAIVGSLSVATLVMLAVVELVTTPLVYIFAAALQTGVSFRSAATLRIGFTVSKLLAVLVVALLGEVTVGALAVALLVSSVAYIALCLRRVVAVGMRPRLLRPGRDYVRSSTALSLPQLAGSIQSDADKAVLAGYGFTREAGLYGAAWRALRLAQIPSLALNFAAFQRFLPHDETAVGQHVSRARRFAKVNVALAGVLAVALWFLAPFLDVVLGDEFRDSISLLRWLLPYVPLTALVGPPLNALLGLGCERDRGVIIVGSAALSAVLYLVLIPQFSSAGAVASTLIAEVVLVVASWTVLVRRQAQHDAEVRSLVAAPGTPPGPGGDQHRSALKASR